MKLRILGWSMKWPFGMIHEMALLEWSIKLPIWNDTWNSPFGMIHEMALLGWSMKWPFWNDPWNDPFWNDTWNVPFVMIHKMALLWWSLKWPFRMSHEMAILGWSMKWPFGNDPWNGPFRINLWADIRLPGGLSHQFLMVIWTTVNQCYPWVAAGLNIDDGYLLGDFTTSWAFLCAFMISTSDFCQILNVFNFSQSDSYNY